MPRHLSPAHKQAISRGVKRAARAKNGARRKPTRRKPTRRKPTRRK